MAAGDVALTVAELEHQRPGWLIVFGGWTRRFWAHGWMLARPEGGVWVTAETPSLLLQRIDFMEQRYPRHPAPWQEGPTTEQGAAL